MKRYKVGDRVTWKSQANGGLKEKRGVVFCVIPPGVSMNKIKAQAELSRQFCDHATWATDFAGLSRKEESYLVVVSGSSRQLPRVYWPRSSALHYDDAFVESGGEA